MYWEVKGKCICFWREKNINHLFREKNIHHATAADEQTSKNVYKTANKQIFKSLKSSFLTGWTRLKFEWLISAFSFSLKMLPEQTSAGESNKWIISENFWSPLDSGRTNDYWGVFYAQISSEKSFLVKKKTWLVGRVELRII